MIADRPTPVPSARALRNMPLLDYWFELTTMAALAAASAFFSGSEAALFSISRADRTDMASGTAADRRAAALLNRPDRLLTAILFWNLVVNLTYYALTEVVSMRLSRVEGISPWAGTLFTIGSLLAVILLSEVLPKSLAVLKPRWLSGLVSTPISATTRVIEPVLPSLQAASDACARLLLPKLEQEPYMELSDLEKAVKLQSGETIHNESLLIQERLVLQRVVELADLTVAELMRPRRRCLVLRPPVSLADLQGQTEGVGEYIFVTEKDSDEIASAIAINRLALLPPDRLDARAEQLAIVPWCASAADTLNRLREEGRRVAVVVNEHGETIGIVPLDRLLDVVLRDTSRIDPHDAHAARLARLDDDAWEASGSTPLRRIAKHLGPWLDDDDRDELTAADLNDKMIAARSRTVGGLLQEQLERPPRPGDQVEVGGLSWTVLAGAADHENDDPLIVRLEITQNLGDSEGDGQGGGI